MTRFVHVTVLVLVVAASRVASAQEGGNELPGGGTIMFSELKIHEDNNDELDFPKVKPESEWHYFNLAHCQCGAPGINTKTDYNEDTFAYLLTIANPSTTPNGSEVQVWVGPNCPEDVSDNDDDCSQLDGAGTVDTIKGSMGVRPELSVFKLMAPSAAGSDSVDDCSSTGSAGTNATLWVMVNDDGGDVEYSNSQTIAIDRGPPPMPTALNARGGESAIQLSWTPPTDTSDSYAYQALCAKASDNAPAIATGRPAPLYDTAASLCEATDAKTQVELTGVDIATPQDAPDAGVVTPTGGLKNLDAAFICGSEQNPTATGMRIGGLQNNVAYNVVLLAIDKFGNARGRYFTSTITPIPSIDFWEDLQGRDGDIDGGLCLLAETYGDDSSLTSTLRSFRDTTLRGSAPGRWLAEAYYATLGSLGGYVHGSSAMRVFAGVVLAPLVAVALLWHWLTMPGLLAMVALAWLWRRRSSVRSWRFTRHALAAAVGFVVLGLAPAHAHAGGYQPYWENSNIASEEELALEDDPNLVTWLVGLRTGPYVPDIDDKFAGSLGPYKQMFGGYHMLVALDLERVVWSRFGQLAVGGTLGYTQKRARSFTIDSDPSSPMRERATDENKFRMIPTALTASYHFTMLDDEYGIPVVPYVRAGLSYYVWWVSDSSGISTACKDGSDKATNPTCSKDKALGASLGVQGSIGLAIRAERIDAATANSMRQSGIQHAGIYGELSIAKVDGFGSDSKLSLGDRTWFAGVNFEF